MSLITSRSRLTLAGAFLAVAGLVLAGAQTGVLPAHAADHTPALHQTARISLGTTSNIFKNAFTEAPDGTVFYSRGSVVYVVAGTSNPAVALHASRPVMALAANSSDLFVLTGLTVTEYARSNGASIRHWTLTSPFTPLTEAGLLVVGHTLWAWTDWGTDSSGFEYANVDRIITTSATVHLVDKKAFPADVAANSAGLYYQDARGAANILSLASVTPTGSLHTRPQPNVDAPEALWGGRLNLLASHSGHLNIDSYRPGTLARISSARVSGNDRTIAGTSIGLLVLAEPCGHITCASATVSRLSFNGLTSGAVSVPNAFTLLAGPAAGVVEDVGGHMFLVRLGS